MPAPLPRAWMDVLEACSDGAALGGGAFAEVFKVRHRQTHQCFAVKVMHRPNFVLRGIERQIEAEVEAMRAAAKRGGQEAANIVSLLDVAEDGEYVFLLLELCGGGDLLRRLIAAPTQRFSEENAASWARQLLLGLRTVHSLGFIHRDIKPDNLLLTDDSILKIADFGWCCLVEEAPTCLAGTFQYMAPEVLRNLPQTPKADVWSAGVTLYQMLMGRALLTTYLGPGATQLTERDPHKSTAIKQRWLVDEIEAVCPPAYEKRPTDLSLKCWDFLRMLLVPEPEQRGSVDALLEHPWLAEMSPVPAQAPGACFAPPAREAAAAEAGPTAAAPAAPEETGPEQGRKKDMAMSPPCRRARDARSPPSTGRASPESIQSVPTPLKPRTWDPTRNIAYTPPMEKDQDQEGLTPERENREQENGPPETSPERKALLASAERPSRCHASPKDTLVETARAPLQRLSPPVPAPAAPVHQGVARQLLVSAASQDNLDAAQPQVRPTPKIDPQAATMLLQKLHNCKDKLQQIHAAMVDRRPKHVQFGQATLASVREASTDRLGFDARRSRECLDFSRKADCLVKTARHYEAEPAAAAFDALTATAPPLQLGAASAVLKPALRTIDAPLRASAEALRGARCGGLENAPPANLTSVAVPPSSGVWKSPVASKPVVWRTATPLHQQMSPIQVPGSMHLQQFTPAPALPGSRVQVVQQHQPQVPAAPPSSVWSGAGCAATTSQQTQMRQRRATAPPPSTWPVQLRA